MLSPSARRPVECDGGRGRSGVGRRSHRAERDQDRRRRLVRGGSPEDGGGQEHRAERTNPHASLHPVQDGLLGSRSDLVIAVSAGHTCFDAVAGSWVRENLVADGPRLQSTSGWYRESNDSRCRSLYAWHTRYFLRQCPACGPTLLASSVTAVKTFYLRWALRALAGRFRALFGLLSLRPRHTLSFGVCAEKPQ